MEPTVCSECGNYEFRFYTQYYGKPIYECTSCGHLVSVETGNSNESQAVSMGILQAA